MNKSLGRISPTQDKIVTFPVKLDTDVDPDTNMLPANRRHVLKALTYGASVVTQAGVSDVFTLIVTDTSAFTIANPTGLQKGMELTYIIKNSSGGAMGAITWDTTFKLAGSFTNPASTKRRVISFIYDGTDLVEKSRVSSDI